MLKQECLEAPLMAIGRPLQAVYHEARQRKDGFMISILEARYGHIVERLLKCWGSPAEFSDLYDDLFFDTRNDHRSGWPADVQAELQFLRSLHELAYDTNAEAAVEEVSDDIKWV